MVVGEVGGGPSSLPRAPEVASAPPSIYSPRTFIVKLRPSTRFISVWQHLARLGLPTAYLHTACLITAYLPTACLLTTCLPIACLLTTCLLTDCMLTACQITAYLLTVCLPTACLLTTFPALSCIKLPAGTVAAPPVLCLGTRGKSGPCLPIKPLRFTSYLPAKHQSPILHTAKSTTAPSIHRRAHENSLRLCASGPAVTTSGSVAHNIRIIR
jgi:hypothetical protein